jgi:hypothetical protein
MFIHLQGSHKKLEEKGSEWVDLYLLCFKCEPYTHCGKLGILHLKRHWVEGGYMMKLKSLFKTNNLNHGQVEFYSYCFKSEITFDHFHGYGSDAKLPPRKIALIYNLQGKNGMREEKRKKKFMFYSLRI